MEQKYRLVSPLGLNARVASLIVGVFNRFALNTITVHYNGESADGKSILSLITLVVKSGEEINIEPNYILRTINSLDGYKAIYQGYKIVIINTS